MATHKHRRTRVISLPSERSERGGGPGRGPEAQAQSTHLSPPASPRRGVILLVLLGMLALFAATAFAFVVIASHGKRAALSDQKIGRVTLSPRRDLDEAMFQLLRGPKDNTSVLRGHSLLEDMYGDNWIGGWIVSDNTLQPSSGNPWTDPKGFGTAGLMPPLPRYPSFYARQLGSGQLIEFIAGYTIPRNRDTGIGATAHYTYTMPPNFGTLGENAYGVAVVPANPLDNEPLEFARRVGCVLTVVDPGSPAYNKSTRIVGYRRAALRAPGPAPQPVDVVYHLFQILPFEGVGTADTVDYFGKSEFGGADYVINGPAFTGMGAGLRLRRPRNDSASWNAGPVSTQDGTPNAGYDNDMVSNRPLSPFALLPNPTDPKYHAPIDVVQDDLSAGADGQPDYIPVNSANEEYDAPDYQNMFMALQLSDGTTRAPSLHRPALANYWYHRLFAELALPPYSISDPVLRWRGILQPKNYLADPALTRVLQVKRRFMLRPLTADHPNFDGSNSRSVDIDLSVAPYDTEAGLAGLVDNYLFEKFGPWDVDNDGDTIPDSIWVDIGLPVRTLPDGRKYRPLVAILCVDQDGKINLNTAGTVDQLRNGYATAVPADGVVANPGYLTTAGGVNDGVVYAQSRTRNNDDALTSLQSVALPRGQGVGPAEINPKAYLTPAVFYNLLEGEPDQNLDGRYGELFWNINNLAVLLPTYDAAATFHIAGPGATNVMASPDALHMLTLMGFPSNNYFFDTPAPQYSNNYFLSTGATGSMTGYGSPMDLRGGMSVGLDMLGRPIYSNVRAVHANMAVSQMFRGWNNAAWNDRPKFLLNIAGTPTDYKVGMNSPYEMRVSSLSPQGMPTNVRIDNVFTVAELEALLRRYDADVRRLPQRLRELLDVGSSSTYRHLVTTESWDTPVTSMAAASDVRTEWQDADIAMAELKRSPRGLGTPRSLADLVTAKVQKLYEANLATPWLPFGGTSTPYYPRYSPVVAGGQPPSDTAMRIDLPALFSPELLAGLPMNLNRPFGNGLDDDGNGIVDEPTERLVLAANDLLEQFYLDKSNSVNFDHDNDAITTTAEGKEYRDSGDPNDPQINHLFPQPYDPADMGAALDTTVYNPFNPAVKPDPGFDPIYHNRYLYAKQLYVLMMLLVGDDWYPWWDEQIRSEVASGNDPPPAPIQAQARARAIAQWAVNVVDFVDRDAVMTPFEYDIYPFAAEYNTTYPMPNPGDGELVNTWNVDGDILTKYSEFGDEETEYRDVVWGCERPELLITETLATHDRRTRDTAAEDPPNGTTTTGTPPDPNFDQVYRPEGNLFVEVYNPSPPTEPRAGEFYGTQGGVALDQTSPDGTPVWRMAVGRSRDSSGTLFGQPANPNGFLDPEADVTPEALVIERFVYFTPAAVATQFPDNDYIVGRDANVVHYPSGKPVAEILPGRYAVIGPGRPAAGDAVAEGTTLLGAPPDAAGSIRRIILNPNADPNLRQVQVFADDSTDDLATKPPVVAIVIDKAKVPAGTEKDVRLSITEKYTGYLADTDPNYDYALGYNDGGGNSLPKDEPEDYTNTDFYGTGLAGDLAEDATTPVFRFIHLQRLANPLRAWHPERNPYLTVDSAPVDLTVFNSARQGVDDPLVPTNWPTPLTPPDDVLATRQRGETGTAAAASLWASLEFSAAAKAPTNIAKAVTNGAGHEFAPDLGQTLGYCNEWYWTGAPLDAAKYSLPTAYDGAPGTETNPTDTYGTFNPDPFPWLTWLNRPLGNPLELMHVPAVRSSRLLTSCENVDTFASTNPYLNGNENFGHLLNFFSDDFLLADQQALSAVLGGKQKGSPYDISGGTDNARAPHLYRLLEYVTVPSRFLDAHTHANPTKMNGGTHVFHPPNHLIPQYREPGKVNLNTLFDRPSSQVISQALSNGHGGPTWPNFALSRHGYTMNDYAVPEGTYLPTRFANPFRSFAGIDRVPYVPGNPTMISDLIQNSVNSTLLREQFSPFGGPPTDPLFADSSFVPTDDYRDSDKSGFFRYQSLARLSNLTTTRSNVYAVWATVGYFEVEEVPNYNPTTQAHIYRDGYTLGQELGIDTGDVTRRRAFYILDRSIPVGFVPGKDLNSEKAILLRRFIE